MKLPLPPFELATRVGSLQDAKDPWVTYEHLGEATRLQLMAALPEDYSLEGRRVLDFGCGAGRTLRSFVRAEFPGELWGCDIDVASVAWLEENLSPPVHPFGNDELPPLDRPDETFDLIYCVSVFTHLARSWSAWLLELHRVLKPDGLMLVTFMGEGQSQLVAGEPWNEDVVGMLTLNPGQSWDVGGPMILHSPWWIREHWGRLFDVVSLTPHGFLAPPGSGHGLVLLRKRDVRLTPAELEALSDDPREAPALAHNVDRLIDELEQLRPALAGASAEAEARRRDVEALAQERHEPQQVARPHRLRRLAARLRRAPSARR